MKKRLLSLLFAVVMVISMMPAMSLTAFAATTRSGVTADWKSWSSSTSLPTPSTGTTYYYLTSDVTLGSTWTLNKGAMYLDLNGHTIKRAGDFAIKIDSSATLHIYDQSAGAGVITTNNKGRGIYVYNGTCYLHSGKISNCGTGSGEGGGIYIGASTSATCYMYDGFTITGCSTQDGGGVFIYKGAFYMSGGEIKSNTVTHCGGGVSNNAGTFNLSGGSIHDNKTTDSNDNYQGGGVFVYKGGTFTMAGGSIYSNRTAGRRGGGGLFVDGSGTTATMTGGTIYSNSATYSSGKGGGVYVRSSGTFTLNGGYIYSNSATGSYSGIYNDGGTVKYTSGRADTNNSYTPSPSGTFTITLNNNGGSPSTASLSGQKWSGTLSDSGVPTRTGYNFSGYYTASSGGEQIYNSSGKAVNSTCNFVGATTLYAHWSVKTASLSYNANGHGTAPSTVTMKYTTACNTASALTATGWTFTGWNTKSDGTGTHYAAGAQFKAANVVPTAATLYAEWTEKTAALTYDANGHGTAPGNVTMKYTTACNTASALTATGWEFTGWNTKSDGTGTHYAAGAEIKAANTEPVAITLYAQWTANTYTVTYHANGGAGAPDAESATYDVNLVVKDAPTWDGHTFKYWNTRSDGEGTTYNVGDSVKNLTAEPNATVTLYAIWSENQTLTYDSNGHGTAPDSVAMQYDEAYSAADAITGVDGYTFNGWNTQSDGKGTAYAAGAEIKAANTEPVAITLYAQWTANTYAVTFNKNGGETEATPNPINETYGGKYTLPTTEPTRAGYTFDGWFTANNGGEKVTESTEFKATEAVTLYAHWTVNKYTVTLENLTDATCAALTEYTYGAGATLPTPTRTGYTFDGWYDNENFTGTAVTDITTTDTGDKVFYAKWTANKYTVTLHDNGAETCAALTGYTYGVSATLPTPTRTGYTFDGWYDNENFTGTAVTKIMKTDTGDKEFYAKWTAGSFTVTFEMCDHGTDLEAIENVAYGATIEKPTDPTATGYTFGGWYTDADCKDGDKWIFDTATVTANTTLYAKWTAKTYAVTLNNGANMENGDVEVTYDEALPSVTPPAKDGYSFLGYFTNENGKGVQYYNADGTGTRPWHEDDNVTLYAHWKKDVEIGLNLLLDGDTGMDFTVTVNNEELRKTLASDGYIELSMGETKKDVSFGEATDLGNGKYKCVFNVNALQMAEKVTIKVCRGDNVYAEATTSVEEYYNLIKDRTDYGDDVKSLAKALVNYGYYAQQAVKAEDYAHSTRQDNPSTAASDLQAYKAVRNGEIKHVTKFAFSLLMENKTTLCLYFQTSDGNAPEIIVDGVSAAVTEQSGESWLVRIPNIDAMHLADVHKIETDGYTYYVSALSYAAAAEAAKKYDSATAICALYDYYEAALAYSGKSGIASATADAPKYTYTGTVEIAPELTVTTTNGGTLSEYIVTWDGDLTTAGKHVGIVKSNDDSVLGSQVVVIEIVEAEPEGKLPAKSAPPKEPADGDPDEPAEEPTPEEPANKGDDENGSGADDDGDDPTGETPAETTDDPTGGDEGGE